jgi:hypothetical protein
MSRIVLPAFSVGLADEDLWQSTGQQVYRTWSWDLLDITILQEALRDALQSDLRFARPQTPESGMP